MARADFYILNGAVSSNRFTCSITYKAWSNGNTVYIHTMDSEHAGKIDDILWTYHDISFLPHSRVDETEVSSPITVGWSGVTMTEADVVINLTESVPESAKNYKRVIEIITDDPEVKNKGRQRYKTYRDMGFEMKNHKIEKI